MSHLHLLVLRNMLFIFLQLLLFCGLLSILFDREYDPTTPPKPLYIPDDITKLLPKETNLLKPRRSKLSNYHNNKVIINILNSH
jgi:hypothetical protein